jgi:hypothetical protein
MEIQKIRLREDDRGVLVCPYCGLEKTTHLARFKGRKALLKVKCTCQQVFRIFLELRKHYRKKTHLRGHYREQGVLKNVGDIHVEDLSMVGMGFTANNHSRLKAGQKLEVTFHLDDRRRSRIEKKVLIKWKNNHRIGGEFTLPQAHYDSALGFYLMR